MSYRRVSSRINQLLRLTSSSSSIERFQKSSSPPFSINRSYSHMSNGSGLGSLFRPEPWLLRGQSTASASGLVFFPRFSSTVGGGSNKIEYMEDVAEVFVESTMEAAAQAPAVSEVAVAAADSYLPVAALQYVIDWVHTFTGLNWWAAIALTTLLMRGATIPILVNQLKATSKLSLMRPHMEEIKEQMQNTLDPKVTEEGRQRMKDLFKQYGVTPLTPFKGILIQGPLFISFYLGITNMVEKVPSFKEGGAFWFVDLTTPDNLYIFPVLTSLSFLATVELNMQEGMEGNPIAGTMKNFSRFIAFATVPITMSFPKAIFCYWVTSNLFSLVYGLVIKRPPVKKFLGLPDMVPDAAASRINFPFFQTPSGGPSPPGPAPFETQPFPEKRVSSSSVISQRIRNLERTVKGRKKNKKRAN